MRRRSSCFVHFACLTAAGLVFWNEPLGARRPHSSVRNPRIALESWARCKHATEVRPSMHVSLCAAQLRLWLRIDIVTSWASPECVQGGIAGSHGGFKCNLWIQPAC